MLGFGRARRGGTAADRMMRLLRWLVGFRDDIDLSGHWWHRLLTVLWFLSVLALGGSSVLTARRAPALVRSNIEPIAALKSYAAERTDLPNAVPAFEALGPVGLLTEGREEVRPMSGLSVKVFCSHALAEYPGESLAFLQRNFTSAGGVPAAQLQLADVQGWMIAAEARDGPIEPGSCLDFDDVLPDEVDLVVAYRYTGRAQIHSYLDALGYAAVVAGLFALVTLNLYYRGLLYTIVGPRRQSGPGRTP